METPATNKQKVLEKAAIVPRAVWLRRMGDNARFQALTGVCLAIGGGVGELFWRLGARDVDDETIRERKLLFMR